MYEYDRYREKFSSSLDLYTMTVLRTCRDDQLPPRCMNCVPSVYATTSRNVNETRGKERKQLEENERGITASHCQTGEEREKKKTTEAQRLSRVHCAKDPPILSSDRRKHRGVHCNPHSGIPREKERVRVRERERIK